MTTLVDSARRIAAPCATSDAVVTLTETFDRDDSSAYNTLLRRLCDRIRQAGAWTRESDCALAISASSDASITITPVGDDHAIVISEGLILAIGATCELRHLHHLDRSKNRPTRPQIGILQMASQYRRTRTIAAPSTGEVFPQEVHQQKAIALLFLVLHEIGHLETEQATCVDLGLETNGQQQDAELQADAYATRALLSLKRPESDHVQTVERVGAAVTSLFETFDLLEVASEPDRTHPFAVWRLSEILRQLGGATADRTVAQLRSGAQGFWYTDTEPTPSVS